MLIIAIILTIISLVTPNWIKESVPSCSAPRCAPTGNLGLFSTCITDPSSGIRTCSSANPPSKIKLARNLIMLSILLLIVALVMNIMSEKNPNNDQVKMIGMICYILGLISIIVGIVTYKQDVPTSTPTIKYSYDFSYYFAIVSVVLTLGAGICNLVHKNK
jgi:predicted membrane channel-forming protein YqfA (hemolysin III family)